MTHSEVAVLLHAVAIYTLGVCVYPLGQVVSPAAQTEFVIAGQRKGVCLIEFLVAYKAVASVVLWQADVYWWVFVKAFFVDNP